MVIGTERSRSCQQRWFLHVCLPSCGHAGQSVAPAGLKCCQLPPWPRTAPQDALLGLPWGTRGTSTGLRAWGCQPLTRMVPTASLWERWMWPQLHKDEQVAIAIRGLHPFLHHIPALSPPVSISSISSEDLSPPALWGHELSLLPPDPAARGSCNAFGAKWWTELLPLLPGSGSPERGSSARNWPGGCLVLLYIDLW